MSKASIMALALLSLVGLPAAADGQQAPEPLETIRNYQVVHDDLASAGQIGYEQIPLLEEAGYDVVVRGRQRRESSHTLRRVSRTLNPSLTSDWMTSALKFQPSPIPMPERSAS